MNTQPRFTSECPKCGHERPQIGHSLDELEQLLETGAEVEAYCSSCDIYWPLSTEDRADLERALTRRK